MGCHYPKPAYLDNDGKVTFVRRDRKPSQDGFTYIPCGMCRGCKAKHARDWAIRCYHESQLHLDSCFITLTYDPVHLPPHGSLQKSDLQKFFKRLRKAGYRFRYFACGEYGSLKGRPHYHAVLFGFRPVEQTLVEMSKKGHPQYSAKVLNDAWPHGRIVWTEFNQDCARYVAHYTADKLKGFAKDEPDPETGLRPYEVMDRDGTIWTLQPEFQLQSLKPAIGLRWLERWWKEVFPADSVVMGEREYPPPRFYYQWLKDNQPDVYQVVQENRRKKAKDAEYLSGERLKQIASAKDAKLARYTRDHDRSKKDVTTNGVHGV